LTAGYQMSMSIHGIVEFSQEYPLIYQQWYKFSKAITVLSLPNEEFLKGFASKLSQNNIKFSIFIEPDINNQVTAIAIEPSLEAKKLCSSIPLALKEYNKPKAIHKHFNGIQNGQEDVVACNL